MFSFTLFVFYCFILASWNKVQSQESFQQQAEREKQFDDKQQNEDAQSEETRRSPTGKFLLLKGEIRDDDDTRNDLSLLDRLMPSKTKVIIDGGAAFPFPPPPPPPPMLPPQFLLPPPPHAFIPSVLIGPSPADFGPLSLTAQEPKAEEEATSALADTAQFIGSENTGDQSRPTMDNMIRPVSEGPGMMQQQEHFQNIMADMQQQNDWSAGRFRFMPGAGGDMQQDSSQRFQGMLPIDMQPQESTPPSQHFPGSSFDMQPEQQRFQNMMVSPMPMNENNPQAQSSSRIEPQQESSWSAQRFQASFGGDSPQQEPSQNQHSLEIGNNNDVVSIIAGKIQQQMPGSFQAQFSQQEFGKSNKKNKDKAKFGQQQKQNSSSTITDLKPEPEPPGCSCGPFFKQTGWGHLKRCAKRCAAHHHHDHNDQSE